MNREFWLTVREALLMLVAAIEQMLSLTPTTKECRDRVRRGHNPT